MSETTDYDWRDDLRDVYQCSGKLVVDTDEAHDRLAAYIESLEAARPAVYDCRETPDECGGIPYAEGVAAGILVEREREDVEALVEAAKRVAEHGGYGTATLAKAIARIEARA